MTRAGPLRATRTGWTRDQIGGLSAGGLTVLGAFLPWANVDTPLGTVSKIGVDGDGAVTLVLGMAVAVLFAFPRRRRMYTVSMVLGGSVTAIAIIDWIDVDGLGSTSAATVRGGVGLYVTMFGGLAALFCGQAERRRLASPPGSPSRGS